MTELPGILNSNMTQKVLPIMRNPRCLSGDKTDFWPDGASWLSPSFNGAPYFFLMIASKNTERYHHFDVLYIINCTTRLFWYFKIMLDAGPGFLAL